METARPDGMESGAAVVLAVALLSYLVLTMGFVCGICLLGVHGLLLVAAALLALCAAALQGAGRLHRRAGALVLVFTVLVPWFLFTIDVFRHVGGATVPFGMTVGATIAFLDRMEGAWRAAMAAAGAAGVAGLLLHRGESGFGLLLHQVSLVALAGLLVVMLVRARWARPGPS